MPQTAKQTAGAVLAARIGEQAARLATLEPAVRTDEPDAVHQMRVACRRLRSAIQANGRLLTGGDELVEELRWLGGALGRARDSEVLGDRLLTAARAMPQDTGRDIVMTDLAEWSQEQYRQARPEVVAALDSARFQELMASLAAFAADPPLSPKADRPARPELVRALDREHRRTTRRIEAADRAPEGEETELALHAARKAAKRARYQGELAGPAAKKFTARMKAVQDLLGVHQDAVIACSTLRTLSDGGFGYGVLYGEQLAAAARAREELPALWKRAGKPPKLSSAPLPKLRLPAVHAASPA